MSPSSPTTNLQIYRSRRDTGFILGICAIFTVSGALLWLLVQYEQAFPKGLQFIVLAIPVALILSEAAWLPFLVLYPLASHLTYIPVELGAFTVSIERLLALGGGAAVLVSSIIQRRAMPRIPGKVRLSLLALIGALLLSLVFHPSSDGFARVLGLLQKSLFAYMVFVAITDVKKLQLSTRAFMVATAFWGIAVLIAIAQTGNFELTREGGDLGILSFLGRYTVLISYTLSFSAFAMWFALIESENCTSKANRSLWVGIAVFFLIVSLLQLRRQVLLTMPLLFIAATLMRIIRLRFRMIIALTAAVWFFVGVVLPDIPVFKNRLVFGHNEMKERGDLDRIEVLTAGVSAVAKSPLIGHGPGNFWRPVYNAALTSNRETILVEYSPVSSHNSFVELAVENGLLGFLLFATFLFLIYRIIMIARRLPEKWYIGSFLKYAPVVFFQMLVFYFFSSFHNINFSWFIIGMLLAGCRLVKSPVREPSRIAPISGRVTVRMCTNHKP